MILRYFDPTGDDAHRLATFACSSGEPFEDDVEQWIRTTSVAWLNDVPRTTFQRRVLALLEDGGELVAVAAWQDIIRVDLEGIWLQVLAISTTHQHGGNGRGSYELVVEVLRQIERDGDHVAGLVHPDNHRSRSVTSHTATSASGRSAVRIGSATIPMPSTVAGGSQLTENTSPSVVSISMP